MLILLHVTPLHTPILCDGSCLSHSAKTFSSKTLVDIPCAQLASTLNFTERKAADLQENVQRALDRKEEVRQSKELLQLYVKAVERQESQAAHGSQEGMQLGPRAGAQDCKLKDYIQLSLMWSSLH